MCLVPNIVVPKKFCVPEFIKYTGTHCLTTHLKFYFNKRVEVVHYEKLFMHFFQDRLGEAALSWCIKLNDMKT
jgi:hypothetical protein